MWYLRIGITLGLCLFAAASPRDVSAGDPRDIVFECPCSAVWVSDSVGDSGTLTLDFGIRSFRATPSANVRIAWNGDPEAANNVGQIGAGEVLSGLRLELRSNGRPTDNDVLALDLSEDVGKEVGRRVHETLPLWPESEERGSASIRFVDILTDFDGDGDGDVNERIAGTDPFDPASMPGDSTVDVLWIHDVPTTYEVPYAQLHHRMTVANRMFVDSGTKIQLRGVGVVFWDGRPAEPSSVWVDRELVRHGADVAVYACGNSCGALAFLNGVRGRGAWTYHGGALIGVRASAATLAHELGHVFGLAHSAQQGEAFGAFRWSRGHFPGDHYQTYGYGTIMAYGHDLGVFSSPSAMCRGLPCGQPVDAASGADAVRSLQLVRFQVASHHASKNDSDEDGFVDPVDVAPDDAAEWFDSDGDGLGDNVDMDDDDDGVADLDDVWPMDPNEWADVDGDGVGDNADDDVEDFSPFEDPGLFAAVRSALGKSPTEPVSTEEIASLTSLNAGGKDIRNLAGLELARGLKSLDLSGNGISDIEPLAALTGLKKLIIYTNQISDITPLGRLTALEDLNISYNHIADLSALSSLRNLKYLSFQTNSVSDLAPLSGLVNLVLLHLSDNRPVRDLSALAGLPRLRTLILSHNRITDISPLGGLVGLETLSIRRNEVTDIQPLASMRELRSLDISGNPIEDFTPLAKLDLYELRLRVLGISELPPLSHMRRLFTLDLGYNKISDLSPLDSLLGQLDNLDLAYNRISDVSDLRELQRVRRLDLRWNAVSDLSPITEQSIWRRESASLRLTGNPLGGPALLVQIPALESWGVSVEREEVLTVPDSNLRVLIGQAIAGNSVFVDEPLTRDSIRRLGTLFGFDAGITDLSGIESATNLRAVALGSNAISDLSPLADLRNVVVLDLNDNLVSDLAPLMAIGSLEELHINNNPLTETSLNEYIPSLTSVPRINQINSIG